MVYAGQTQGTRITALEMKPTQQLVCNRNVQLTKGMGCLIFDYIGSCHFRQINVVFGSWEGVYSCEPLHPLWCSWGKNFLEGPSGIKSLSDFLKQKCIMDWNILLMSPAETIVSGMLLLSPQPWLLGCWLCTGCCRFAEVPPSVASCTIVLSLLPLLVIAPTLIQRQR